MVNFEDFCLNFFGGGIFSLKLKPDLFPALRLHLAFKCNLDPYRNNQPSDLASRLHLIRECTLVV